jgi:hypothetical protein
MLRLSSNRRCRVAKREKNPVQIRPLEPERFGLASTDRATTTLDMPVSREVKKAEAAVVQQASRAHSGRERFLSDLKRASRRRGA